MPVADAIVCQPNAEDPSGVLRPRAPLAYDVTIDVVAAREVCLPRTHELTSGGRLMDTSSSAVLGTCDWMDDFRGPRHSWQA